MLDEGAPSPCSPGPAAGQPEGSTQGWIVIVVYQGLPYLPAVLASCALHAASTRVVVVDNASSDGGADYVRAHFPEAHVVVLDRNRGFAGGNNEGIRHACRFEASWVLLLNQDAELRAGTVDTLVAALDRNPRAGAVQPAVMRADGLVNSLGNPIHWLGFSEAGGNGLSIAEAERDPRLPWLHDGRWRRDAVQVPACSGAAVMLRTAALADVGLFEDELFLYHEDVELSWRLRRAGWTCCIAGAASVTHHYSFSRNPRKFYFMERNRHWVLFAHLRAGTLGVLAPPLLTAECLIWVAALRGGWAREKVDAYGYWFGEGRAAHLRARRRDLKALRRVDDRELLATASTGLAGGGGAPYARLVEKVSTMLWRALRPLVRG